LPTTDAIEGPTIFTAITYAEMLAPHAKLYGDAVNIVLGIVQNPSSMIVLVDPSQFVKFSL
jgi:hypothetical protein